MGDRSFIQVSSKDFATPITFYGHWSGEDNVLAVRNVLSTTDRIGDVSYLAAQIFYEFAVKQGGYEGGLSFGIDTFGYDPDGVADNPTVYVNADTGEYTYQGVLNDEFTKMKV